MYWSITSIVLNPPYKVLLAYIWRVHDVTCALLVGNVCTETCIVIYLKTC